MVGRPPTDHFFTVQLVHDYQSCSWPRHSWWIMYFGFKFSLGLGLVLVLGVGLGLVFLVNFRLS